MKKILLYFIFIALVGKTVAQTTFPVNGTRDERHPMYAFTNATIFVDYQTKIENGILVVQNNKIISVGSNIRIPEGAKVVDLAGRTIYPSFIELSSDYGIALQEKKEDYHGSRPIEISRKKGAYHWNQAIRPEINGVDFFVPDAKKAADMRQQGFGVALTHVRNGISRGTGSCVLLADGKENELIVQSTASSHFSFDKGTSIQDYPSSLMGAIALIRQTYLDAQWYMQNTNKTETNLSLSAWNQNRTLPAFFEVKDKLDILRADKIGKEFGVEYLVCTTGDEYQNADVIAANGIRLVVPVNFPKPIDVSDPMEADRISLKQLKHWELAPSNPSVLSAKGIVFSLSMHGLEGKGEFLKNLRKAVKYGLSPEEALKALTKVPAMFIRMEKDLGALHKGMYANFIITDGDIFDENTVIMENWVGGKPYMVTPDLLPGLSGDAYWDMSISGVKSNLSILFTGPGAKREVKLKVERPEKADTIKTETKFDPQSSTFSLSYVLDSVRYRLIGWMNGKDGMVGKMYDDQGLIKDWSASKGGMLKNVNAEKKEEKIETGKIQYPFMAYGNLELPKTEEIIFKNATVWTNEKEGVLKNTDVHIRGGKIIATGTGLTSSTAKVVDASRLHLTCGIIDEHSHIAASRGVNEGTQASSAEVRVGDVINPEDINIYRQLAGGVTASQILHGSANPIGGQSGLIKLKWGESPANMLIQQADGFIKFALGENVKQSNWGDNHTSRYPQTRMGVEQVYYDMFHQARLYEAEWQKYNGLKGKEKKNAIVPRRDLELETLVEILNSKRFITCHSYQQGEINMLMHVADSMGFRINTFTHILEGYKIADKMKAHGAGGSTFSDWWAYKFEVNDAIPYNAAMMHKMGIVTAINSDDAEMGRRLNQEAAKAIKYGGISEEDAWKMVTLNPAKLLHLDGRMGSIRIGKDADLVLWTDNPLSVYAQVSQTYVDGICYYDVNRSKAKSEEIKAERQRLIKKMLMAIASGEKPAGEMDKKQRLYHCDSIGE